MGCDGNVGGGSIDAMVSVGVNSIVATLEEVVACHLESGMQLEMGMRLWLMKWVGRINK